MALFVNSQQLKAQSGQKWSTSGNTTSNGDFIGTSNNQALLLKTNNQLIIRLKPNGDIVFNNFKNQGAGLLGFDNDGKILPYTFNGNSNTFLNGAGHFVNINGLTGWKIDPSNNNLFQTTTGYVGIGTNNPQLKLHVAGDALVEGYVFTQGISIIGRAWGQKLYSDTIDVKRIEMDSLKSISGETRIDGSASVSQKLGVGTKYPEAELDVRGNMALSGEARIDGYIKIPSLANASNNLLYTDGTGIVKPIALEQLSLGFFNQPQKTCLEPLDTNYTPMPMVWNSTDTKMWLNPVGRCNKLGIGTDNPQEAVDIVGNTNISGRLKVGSNSIIIESLGTGNGILNNIYADNNGNMHLQSNNKSTGKIGIGLNSNNSPQAKLDIETNDSNWAAQFINLAGNGKGVNISAGSGSAAGSVLQVRSGDGNGATNYLLQVNTAQEEPGLPPRGYVGIGTPNPHCTFDVLTSDRTNWTACFKNTWGDGKGVLIRTGAGSTAGPGLLVMDDYGNEYLKVKNSTGITYVKELVVTDVNPFPDFVFDDCYNLLNWNERMNKVKANKHLPYLPSETEVAEEGASVNKVMNGILQNTEELTLYIDQLIKKVEILEQEIIQLKNEK